MKILYAIQGTGNGHVSRAREIIPHLKNHGKVELLLSGTQADVGLEDDIKFRFKGFGFVFGEKGGVDIGKTWQQFDTASFISDCKNLPVEAYDLIINDFEPVCAWACKFKNKKTVALSHQSAYLSPTTPKISGWHWGRVIMKNYAPATEHVAFHFQKYDDFIHTPVIRSEIRNQKTSVNDYYTVYLPAYSDQFIISQLSNFKKENWQVFSKHSKNAYRDDNVEIFPVNNEKFQTSLANSKGLLTGGGFEGPAEAMFMKKKVLAVPMRNQYEQLCNALAMEKMGVPVIWKENEFKEKLTKFIDNEDIIDVDYPDETAEVIRNCKNPYCFLTKFY